jgi:hypothetical protein
MGEIPQNTKRNKKRGFYEIIKVMKKGEIQLIKLIVDRRSLSSVTNRNATRSRRRLSGAGCRGPRNRQFRNLPVIPVQARSVRRRTPARTGQPLRSPPPSSSVSPSQNSLLSFTRLLCFPTLMQKQVKWCAAFRLLSKLLWVRCRIVRKSSVSSV